MMTTRANSELLLLSALGICSVLKGAQAAQANPQDATAAGNMEEITVTARKREESFLDVPVVASVITREMLEQYKTDDLFAIASRVPSLLLGSAVSSVGTQLSLRGVGTTALNPTMDQSIALNVDGLALTQGMAYEVGMFDVAQVEVLKGPQALFFGKNNTGGVISLRSADPTDKFENIVRVGYEREAEKKEADIILSGPVSDSLKLRLATRYSDEEGYFTNGAVAPLPGLGGRVPPYTDFAPAEEWTVRGTALFEPNDKFTARLKLNYNDYRMEGGAVALQNTYCPEGTAAVAPTNIQFMIGDDCSANAVTFIPWMDPAAFPAITDGADTYFNDQTQAFGSLELNFDLIDNLTLTSVTGYLDNVLHMFDTGNRAGGAPASVAFTNFSNRQFTQEIRLTSDYTDRPVNFMVGAFYQDGRLRNELELPGNALLGLPRMLQHVRNVVDIRSVSAFAQMTWDISEKLELAGGARWTDEEREHALFNFNLAQGPLGQVPRIDPRISSSNISPELTLTYKPTNTLTTFASYKTGFKSGSFQGINFTPPDRRASFSDEEVRGGELGLKALLADRRLTANVAAYYYKYDDLQVGAHELADTGGGNFIVILRTLNAASATVKGIEFDGSYAFAAVDGLTLSAAAAYSKARYDSFPNAPCGNGQTISQGCDQLFNPTIGRYTSQDLSDRRLVRAPDWAAYVGIDHQMSLGDDLTLGLGASANYTSEYSTLLVDLPGFEQEAFVKVDANVALKGPDDKWEIALIARNLTDEFTTASCTNANSQNGGVFGGQISGAVTGGPAGGDEGICFVERGREFWGRISFKF
jgi:iron complex outermembrane receptor protein